MKKLLCLMPYALCLALCACTFQSKPRGYIFPADMETELAGIKTVAALEEKFGSPQARTVHGDTVWIYYGATENYHGPLPLSWDERTVMLVWHDGKNIKNTKILHDADLPKVKIAAGATPVPAEIELNAFQELVNNVGRFTPAGLGN
ncbi:MAG: hypothetical protein FWG39_04070 [Alphaproteobacteria bacterium]|nr:hypothetical protein [Alphaproteobacteria bacterium]